jgi:hypothetical protein
MSVDKSRNKGSAAFDLGDIGRAAILVLAMALVGLCIFGLSMGVLQIWGSDLTPSSLEPGLGLSNQALTIAFALAGALASTIVAVAALRAQTSANRAQGDGIAMAERSRTYAEVRRDAMRHAAVIEAVNSVFALAHQITEDTLRAMADQAVQGDAATDDDEKQHLAAILATHHRFWSAIKEAQKTERADLTLGRLWQDMGGTDRAFSRLGILAVSMGAFGTRQDGADPKPGLLSLVTVAARGTPMTLSVASDVLRLVRHSAARLADSDVRISVAQVSNALNQRKRQLQSAKQDLSLVVSAVSDVWTRTEQLSAQVETFRDSIDAIRSAAEELDPDQDRRLLAEESRDLYDEAHAQLVNLTETLAEFETFLPKVERGALAAAFSDQSLEELSLEAYEELVYLRDRMKDTIADLGPKSQERLILARHGVGPDGDAVAAILAFLAGAIVLPDGALLYAEAVPYDFYDTWKANLGLALIDDLSCLYERTCGQDQRTLDLARLVPDNQRLGGPHFASTYGEDREVHVGSLPAAFDALWLMLRRDADRLAAMLLQDHGDFAKGWITYAGTVGGPREGRPNPLDVLEGKVDLNLQLGLDPLLSRGDTSAETETDEDVPA